MIRARTDESLIAMIEDRTWYDMEQPPPFPPAPCRGSRIVPESNRYQRNGSRRLCAALKANDQRELLRKHSENETRAPRKNFFGELGMEVI